MGVSEGQVGQWSEGFILGLRESVRFSSFPSKIIDRVKDESTNGDVAW